ncbi:CERS5_6 [Mytilus edulis]|uniref:CERS5_6 n=1 Tax=Mytilus edulis TaxID=6550 RepID=A0A8S3U216_MYTED|nr:CERS5_6 [Mytilus edulis]
MGKTLSFYRVSMLEWINSLVDRLQPNYLRPEDVERLPENAYVPTLSDLVIPSLVTASCLVVVRHVLDRVVVAPVGAYLGFKKKVTDSLTENPILEKEYSKCKTPNSDTIHILKKKCELTEREISKWFRKRRRNDKVTDIKKLQDASWHFMFYLIMSWYGLFILWDVSNYGKPFYINGQGGKTQCINAEYKNSLEGGTRMKPWFNKSINCWVDWPAQTVSNDIYWYYLIELGFYLSAVYMLFTDHKRKDFTEFIIHHVVTIFLLVLSFSYNLLRAGTLVLCIHDQVDYLLAMAKIAIYCKKPLVADTLFVLFILVWIITRLGIYPYVILYSVYIDLPVYARELGPYAEMYDTCTLMKFVKGALLVLQILHLIWTGLIIKSAAAKFTAGKIQDARSDNEESEIEVDDKIEENGNCKTLDTDGLCQ